MALPFSPGFRRVLGATAFAAAASQSAEAQSGPTDAAEREKPFARINAPARTLRDSAVALARSQVGRPYRFGGQTPSRGFDCSGLVRFVMTALDRDVPRTAASQSASGTAVAKDTTDLRPGDLLTFGEKGRVSHVGIYVGEGRYIHASTTAKRVIESPLDRQGRRIKPWQGARRMLADNGGEGSK